MRSLAEKNMREVRRRLALSRNYADPVTRELLDRISVEEATKEYIRREAKAQPASAWWRRLLWWRQ